MAVIEVESTSSKDLRREIELLDPILNDGASEKLLAPVVHFQRYLLGGLHEDRVAVNRELQVSLVIERHRRDLAERILSIEHPAIRARQQRIGDVADTLFYR